TPSNTPPSLVLPASPVVGEATSPAGAAITYAVSASDAEDDPDPVPTCAPASGSTFALGDTTVSCSVTDSAGATATGSFVVEVVDTTAPTDISISGTTLVDGGDYDFGSVPAAPTGCTASDRGSGLASCTVTGYTSAVGSWTITATATDGAG